MMAWQTIVILAVINSVVCNGDVSRDYAEATEGGMASLPCNITPIRPPDTVSLVQWYRGNEENPFYKYDSRGVRAQHWVEPVLGDRFFLRMQENDKATLTISLSRLEDEDVYHCRVDFLRSPTRITHVNLTVIGECLYSIQTKNTLNAFNPQKL